ncbi:hypothetical protein [Neotabrizicola sp. sgz301269]|uniref:hypothetical protein n=1 Tax=Neotabrizicola sp. sgz301269 TaxID=3276282 RepID=UPI00376F80BA
MARADGDIVITVGGNVSPLTDAVTKAERTLGRLNSATATADRQFRAMVGTTSEVQNRINALTGFTDRLGKSAEKSASAFQMFDQSKTAIDRLRASYDPLFAASKRYEAAVEQLDDALQLGVITQAQYAAMAQKLGASMLTVDPASKAAGQGVGKFGMIANQVGYQIQDVFVSGPMIGWLRAVAQQAPQAAGAFSMLGGSLGTVVPWIGTGIAVGAAIIPMLLGMGKSSEEAAGALDRLKEATSAAQAAQQVASMSLVDAKLKYGELAEEALRAAKAIYGVEMAEAQTALRAALADTDNAFIQSIDLMVRQGDRAGKTLALLASAYNLPAEKARELAAAMADLRDAKGVEDQTRAADRLSALLIDIYHTYEAMPPEVQKVYKGLNDSAKAAADLASVDMASGIASAASEAERLAASLGVSLAQAVSLMNLADSMSYGQIGARGDPRTSNQKGYGEFGRQTVDQLISDWNKQQSKGGGGGGGKKDDTKDRLDKLRKDFQTETEELRTLYEERNAVLAEALNKGLLTEQEYNALRLQAQADFNNKMRALDRAAMEEKLSGWSGAFGDLSSLMNTENKKLFRIGQAAAIAQAVVDGWSSAVSAWEKGMKIGGPPVAAAFTAMSLAKTGAMIASIKSASMNGGGGGSASAGSAGAAAPALPIQRVDIALTGGSADTMTTVQAVIAQLNEAAARGYRVDARLVAA